MRKLALLPLLLAAGCGGSGGETAQANKAKAESGPRAERIAAGRWELVSEVTTFTKADDGAPRINTPVGTRATESLCVGDAEQAPSALFTGAGYRCDYETYYASNGRASITASCRRDDLQGSVGFASNGTFTADTLSYTRNLRTVLSTDGDVLVTSRITGRRTGDCTPG